MDQGFNDDELSDIMNEIESLEQEFQEDTKQEEPSAEQPQASADESQEQEEASHQEPEQSEVVEQLAQKSEEEMSVAQEQAHDDQNVHAIKPSASHSSGGWQHSTMDFSIEGDMKMNMCFKVSGKAVHLHINENAFEIELEGGMKFSIPVKEESSKKAA